MTDKGEAYPKNLLQKIARQENTKAENKNVEVPVVPVAQTEEERIAAAEKARRERGASLGGASWHDRARRNELEEKDLTLGND